MKSQPVLQHRPNPLPLSTRLVSNMVRAPLFLAATALFGTASLLASLVERDGRAQHRIAQLWAAASMRISGSKVTILNEQVLRDQPVAVFCSNHLSYMDTPAIFSSLPFQFRIVARSTLWSIPFIGWHLHRSGQIPVNVDNPRASVASLSGGVKTLKEGMPLFLFPEGGRSRSGHLGPFMNGPAFMALRARVPLIPMALIGTYELLPMHARVFYPVPITLAIGEPIPTENYTMRDIDVVSGLLREAIRQLYYRHSYLVEAEEAHVADALTSMERG